MWISVKQNALCYLRGTCCCFVYYFYWKFENLFFYRGWIVRNLYLNFEQKWALKAYSDRHLNLNWIWFKAWFVLMNINCLFRCWFIRKHDFNFVISDCQLFISYRFYSFLSCDFPTYCNGIIDCEWLTLNDEAECTECPSQYPNRCDCNKKGNFTCDWKEKEGSNYLTCYSDESKNMQYALSSFVW